MSKILKSTQPQKSYLVTYEVYHINRKVTERHTTKVSANLWDWWNNLYDDGEVKYTLIFAIEI